MATVPNFFRQEFMLKDVAWCDEYMSHALPIEEGHFVLLIRPGLGFDVKEEVLLRHPGLRTPPSDRAFYI